LVVKERIKVKVVEYVTRVERVSQLHATTIKLRFLLANIFMSVVRVTHTSGPKPLSMPII
jgi:hypothetical protein